MKAKALILPVIALVVAGGVTGIPHLRAQLPESIALKRFGNQQVAPIRLAQASSPKPRPPASTPYQSPVKGAPQRAPAQLPLSAPRAEPPPRPAPLSEIAAAADQLAPQALLHEAVIAIAGQTSISASLREEIDLFGQRLLGAGTYLQGPSRDHVWRLEMRIQAGQQRQSLIQQIADGRRLWLYRRVLDDQQLRKVELARVAEALAQEQGAAPPRFDRLLMLGGLPKLLAGLETSFRFTSKREGRIRGTSVWLLEGTWQPDVLAKLPKDKKQKYLPDHLPERVVLALGKADLFPYRIEFQRCHPGRFDASRSGLVSTDWWSIVAIELFDVVLNMPIDPRHFIWQAGNIAATDVTDPFIASLKQAMPR